MVPVTTSPELVAEEDKEEPETRQIVNNIAFPGSQTLSGVGTADLSNQARPNSKMTGIHTQTSNEEAAFNRDLEKLKRMIRLHFKNYNCAPPTSCEFYRIGRVLGKGAFGKVSLAMHKLSEQLVAIKSMSKETL